MNLLKGRRSLKDRCCSSGRHILLYQSITVEEPRGLCLWLIRHYLHWLRFINNFDPILSIDWGKLYRWHRGSRSFWSEQFLHLEWAVCNSFVP